MKTRSPSALISGLLAALGLAATGQAADFHVAGAPQLHSALTTAATNGADNTIYLTNAYYQGTFRFNSSNANNLTVSAEPGVTNSAITIDGAGMGSGLYISSAAASNTITVQGIGFAIDTFTQPGPGNPGALCIQAGSQATISVSGCAFLGTPGGIGDGLEILSGLNVTVSGCTVRGAQTFGFGGNGVVVGVTGNVTVQNCAFSTNDGFGVELKNPANSVAISNSIFNGNWSALSLSAQNAAIVSGNTFNGNGGAPPSYPGAVTIESTPAVILTGNTFATNFGNDAAIEIAGGAVFLAANNTVSLTGNTFIGNTADSSGGAVAVEDRAGAIQTANVTIAGNNFIGNSSAANSGDNYSGGTPPSFNGGAVYVNLAAATVTIQANTFQLNTANQNGGALYVAAPTVTISDNLVAANAQTGTNSTGGGVWANASSNLFFINNTITANTSAAGGGGVAFPVNGPLSVLNVFNNIIWANSGTPGADVLLSGTGQERVFSNNDIAADVFDNNLEVDPQFVDPANGNYYLQSASPCIASGTASAPMLPWTDLVGNPRVLGGMVDMGCYAFTNDFPRGFPPSIVQQPASVTTNRGGNVAFGVTAIGTAPLAYQWQFNGNNLPGATNATLTLLSIQTNQAGFYAVVVTNVLGATTSSIAQLTLNVPSAITQQPTSVTASQGANVAFSVTATGTAPLSYQWSFNATSIANATNSTLTLAAVQPANAGSYSVLVSNAAGSVTSSNAVLTVNVPPAITQQPASVTANQGANVAFSVSATGTAPLSYQWSFNATSIANATNSTLTLPAVQPANAGSYSVLVSNAAGSVTGSNAVLTVNVPPAIAQQPASVTANQGATAAFSVTATGTVPLFYQWSFDGTSIPNASNSTLTLPAVQPANAGSYSVLISNAAGSVTSSTAVLTVNVPPAITQQPASVITNQGANVAFSVTATGTAPLSYQWSFNATSIANATNSTLTLPAVQPANAGSYSVLVSNVAGSAAGSIVVLTVNVPPAITQQPASVITNPGANVIFGVGAAGAPPLSYQWRFNGTNLFGATNATVLLLDVQTNQSGAYAVVVSNALGATVSSNALLTVIVPPVMTQPPFSVITNQGRNVTFTVAATGSPPLSYQWEFNGTPIPGATGSSLTLTSAAATNIGYYSVVASNAAGTATSGTASLTFLDLKMYAGLTINSPIKTNYGIQAIAALGGTNWTTLTNVALSNQPYLYIDYNTPTNPMQFYRAAPGR